MARKKRYRFEDRSRYGRGIVSTVTSAVSIVIFLSTAFICMVMAGKAPQWIGALGFSGFVMALTNSAVQVASNSVLSIYGGDLYVGVMTVISSIREVVTMPVMGITGAAALLQLVILVSSLSVVAK